jgi:outer membrane scaffolding protein for murein synthesis (MipA/OmpV family)
VSGGLWQRIRCALGSVLLLLLGSAPPALAAGPQADGSWSLGGIALIGSPLRSDVDGTRLLVPALGYEGRGVFLRGLTAGVWTRPIEGLELQARLQPRMDRLRASDAPALAGLASRQRTLEGVVVASAGPRWLRGTLTAGVDLLDRHGGTFAEFGVSVPVRVGDTRVSLDVAGVWQSAALNRYYHGVAADEANPGRPVYRPDSGLSPRLGLRVSRPFAERWRVDLIGRHTWLDASVRSSPLVERDTRWNLLLGVARRF